jgi:hypothetical protein
MKVDCSIGRRSDSNDHDQLFLVYGTTSTFTGVSSRRWVSVGRSSWVLDRTEPGDELPTTIVRADLSVVEARERRSATTETTKTPRMVVALFLVAEEQRLQAGYQPNRSILQQQQHGRIMGNRNANIKHYKDDSNPHNGSNDNLSDHPGPHKCATKTNHPARLYQQRQKRHHEQEQKPP